MTHRKKSNVCPVCGAQGRLRISVDCFEGVKFVEYIVTCNCHAKPVPMPSKKWAWWWFRNWRTVKMRDFKNLTRQTNVWKRNDIRGWRLPRTAVGLKIYNARLKHS
jgi:hypothetical protein